MPLTVQRFLWLLAAAGCLWFAWHLAAINVTLSGTDLFSTPVAVTKAERLLATRHVLVRVTSVDPDRHHFTGVAYQKQTDDPKQLYTAEDDIPDPLHLKSLGTLTYELTGDNKFPTTLSTNDLLRINYTCIKDNLTNACPPPVVRLVSGYAVAYTRANGVSGMGVLVLVALALILMSQAIIPVGYRNTEPSGFKRLLVGGDNRYSNSQFQMTFWFYVLLIGLISSLIWRVAAGGPDLALGIGAPTDLIALSGFAVVTWVSASALARSNRTARTRAQTAEFYQLYSNDEDQFDYGDFQSLLVTIVAVGGYLIALVGFNGGMQLSARTELPGVGNTILTIFGAGQATYLLKKALRLDVPQIAVPAQVGPVAAPPAAAPPAPVSAPTPAVPPLK